jgi:hypothetical protein
MSRIYGRRRARPRFEDGGDGAPQQRWSLLNADAAGVPPSPWTAPRSPPPHCQAEHRAVAGAPTKSSPLPPPTSNCRHSNLPHLTRSTLHHPMPLTMSPIAGI